MSLQENQFEDHFTIDSPEDTLAYEEVLDFLEYLRGKGFGFGSEQYVDFHRALIALISTENEIQLTPKHLAKYLAPIICTSPAEQEEFYIHLQEWQEKHFPTQKEKTAQIDDSNKKNGKYRNKSIYMWVFVSLSLVVAVFSLIYYLSIPNEVNISGKILDEGSSKPLAGAKIFLDKETYQTDEEGNFSFKYRTHEESAKLAIEYADYPLKVQTIDLNNLEQDIVIKLSKRIQPVKQDKEFITNSPIITVPEFLKQNYDDNFFVFLLLAFLFFPVVFIIWYLLRKWQIVRLRKKLSGKIPELTKIPVESVINSFYRSQPLRQAIQQLRRHHQQDSSDLNIPATIDATISNGGFPKTIYSTQKISPEYLFLIDYANVSDQEARLKEVMINRIIEEGVYVDRYYFDNDPRLCYSTVKSETLLLSEVASRHPNHNLAIFSDGAYFLNSYTALPQNWLDEFSLWDKKVLLTPVPLDSWGYREAELTKSVFPVLPVSPQGIIGFSEIINSGQVPSLSSDKIARGFPRMLEERPLRWLNHYEPDKVEVEKLYKQLRRYLDAEEFYLMCACAVYPILSFELTLYLGYKIGGSDIQKLEDNLFSLVRLPWFRYGIMPDWLRLRLLSGLSKVQEQVIRGIIEKLLNEIIEDFEKTFDLEASTAQQSDPENKPKLYEYILASPEGSPLKDYIFSSFITQNRLTIRVPKVLKNYLFPSGIHRFDTKFVPGFILSWIFSLFFVVMVIYFQPIVIIDDVPPIVTQMVEAISPQPFAPPISSSVNSGFRGELLQMRFASNDCKIQTLKNFSLTASPDSGVTIESVQSENECADIVSMSIALNAPLGPQTLLLSWNNQSTSFPFTIKDITIPTSISMKCPDYQIACPLTLAFFPNDNNSAIVSSPLFVKNTYPGVTDTKFSWVLENDFFSVAGDANTSKVTLSAQDTFSEQDLKINLIYTNTGFAACTNQGKICSTKAIFYPGGNPAPTPVPQPSSVSPKSFTVTYTYGDSKNATASWQKQGETSWVVNSSNNVSSTFKVIGRSDISGEKGTLVAKISGESNEIPNDGSFQIFIPDIGNQSMILRFRTGNQNWQELGKMENAK